jgi:hypothetical protein
MSIELTIDVSEAADLGEPLQVAASIFLPESARDESPFVVCLPGGGYTRDYYDARFPNMSGYSMAEWFTARGCIMCTLDHLGTGASARPRNEPALSPTVIAAANHSASTQIGKMIECGTLPGNFSPIAISRKIGVGHSMGGMLLIVQQALHETFDQVAPVGWTNQVMELGEPFEPPTLPADAPPASRYVVVERGTLQRRLFYWPDIPESLISYDERCATVIPITLLGEIMRPRTVATYAGAITAPVFLAFGVRDNCKDPHREPTTYPACPDITLYILPQSGHCHNFASSRVLLWKRLLAWTTCVSAC